MYDFSFTVKTLEDIISKEEGKLDYHLNSQHSNKTKRNFILSQSASLAVNGYSINEPPKVKKTTVQSKEIFSIKDPIDKLLLRKTTLNIKKAFKPKSLDRNTIISNLNLSLMDNSKFNILRLDIKNCYESFNHQEIYDFLSRSNYTSSTSLLMIESLFNLLKPTGLPRGLALSAAISESILNTLDNLLLANKNILYYARFVDDIIIITEKDFSEEKCISVVQSNLPKNLLLHNRNSSKYYFKSLDKPSKLNKKVAQFNYLGYEISIHDPETKNLTFKSSYRNITINFSQKKAQKYKKMISKAFLDFSKSNDLILLHKRLKFLTSNICVFNPQTGSKRILGLNYSNPSLNDTKSLKELDRYLFFTINFSKSRLSKLFSSKLNNTQKRELSNYSFLKGWENKKFINVSYSDLKLIKKCWKYV